MLTRAPTAMCSTSWCCSRGWMRSLPRANRARGCYLSWLFTSLCPRHRHKHRMLYKRSPRRNAQYPKPKTTNRNTSKNNKKSKARHVRAKVTATSKNDNKTTAITMRPRRMNLLQQCAECFNFEQRTWSQFPLTFCVPYMWFAKNPI